MKFQLGNLSVEKGQKTTGYLKLPFTKDTLPTTIFYGQEDGETALVTGGIHNAEYVGIEAAPEDSGPGRKWTARKKISGIF